MPPRTVLSAHNFYRQAGGEDQGFAAEAALLEQEGHSVVRYEDHNARIDSQIGAGLAGIWNHVSYRRLKALARSYKPDIAHFHNTFPLISPAAYYAVRREGVPIVQTVQNFRLLCPGATLYRGGNLCEDCLGKRSFVPAVVHRCYRGSSAATAGVVSMLVVHRAARTWQRMVDVYIAPSKFVRQKLVEGGLPAGRIVVKPNFVLPDPGPGDGHGGYALFVGRLVEEKGLRILAEAWGLSAKLPLIVAGDGPLRDMEWPDGVTLLGSQTRERVIELMKAASLLIFPSAWYEGAPMTIMEAFACGLPVIASDLGAMRELIEHGRTGLLFQPRNSEDLCRQLSWILDRPEHLSSMRNAVRREFTEKYTAQQNYGLLMEIYEMAIASAYNSRALE